MDFSLSKEQLMIQNMAREFAGKKHSPRSPADREREQNTRRNPGRISGVGAFWHSLS